MGEGDPDSESVMPFLPPESVVDCGMSIVSDNFHRINDNYNKECKT